MAAIETLGDALDARWSVRIRCVHDNDRIASTARCHYEGTLDMATLVCTRGRGFPLARLASRLRCPNCGDLSIGILFDVPGEDIPVWVRQQKRRA